MTGFSKAVRELVIARAGGMCERCGIKPGVQLHHRRPRSMGGSRRKDTNLPANSILCCPPCHCAIESDRDEALRHGWLVRQGREPKLVPVFRRGQWVRLNNEGGYSSE